MTALSNKERADFWDNKLWDEQELWLALVKGHCVRCLKVIKNPIRNYYERGNFCFICNGKFGRQAYRPTKQLNPSLSGTGSERTRPRRAHLTRRNESHTTSRNTTHERSIEGGGVEALAGDSFGEEKHDTARD